MSLNNGPILNEVKALFEANVENAALPGRYRGEKKKSKTKELDQVGPATGSQIKQSLGLFRKTFGERLSAEVVIQ